ncbi:MAG TPA: hypothetical protein VKZ18_21600 [Polyangia bacterium]|nr:hypothetical protein [Polyangia bacterium]
MLPWLWVFAPVNYWYWPLSGAVSENISPEAFFEGMIKPGAGDPEIERQAFELASYGKQLGWLTDVVVAATDAGAVASDPDARGSLASLTQLRGQVRDLKRAHHEARSAAAIALLDRMKADNPDELKSLLARYLQPQLTG